MRILHTVEFYDPSVGGAQEVVKQLSQRLVKLGHEVTVVTTKLPGRRTNILNGVKIEEFDIKGNMVRGIAGETERYRDFVLDGDFDVMMNYAAQQWTTDLLLPILDDIRIPKVLVPCGFSGLLDPRYKEYYEGMRTWMRKYDRCVFLSDEYRDVNFARDNGITNGRLIPNGCGMDEFEKNIEEDIRKKLSIPKDNLLILHVGSHTGLKGHDALLKIFHRADLTNATLLLIGNELGSGCRRKCSATALINNISLRSLSKNKQVILKNLEREETVAAYQQADLFLFPSNIECSPIVLFEAMASRTPFLCTDVGNSREIIDWSGAGVLLPTDITEDGLSHARIDGSASILSELAADKERIHEMGEKGYLAWKDRFTWEGIAKQYSDMYLELLSS